MSNQIVSQVFETSDYFQFKLLQGNRITNKANLKRLKSSMSEEYLMSPIIVNENYEIIDGQHRYKAALELKKPIRYIRQPGYGLSQVQRLNTNMSNWRSMDYLNAYCELGYPEYLRFKEFMETYPKLNFAACKMLLSSVASTSGGRSTKSKDLISATNKQGAYIIKYFEEGDFYAPNYDLSCKWADYLMDISNYYEGFTRSTFVSCMIGLFKSKKFDIDLFLYKLSFAPIKLDHRSNVTQYRELIEDIYNYRNRDKVSFKYL